MDRVVTRWVGVALAAAAALVAMGGCDGTGPSATVVDEVELSREIPRVSVEFEGTFHVVDHVLGGIRARLRPIRPDGFEQFERVGLGAMEREVWDGERWRLHNRWPEGPEISGPGHNVFRFRWTFQPADGVESTVVPFEAIFVATEGREFAPSEDVVSDLTVRVVLVTPSE